MDNRYNRHNRQKYSLKVHIVLVTKYRKQLLKGSITDDVKQEILDIANTRGYEIIAIETDKDHMPFLLSYDTADRVGSLTVVSNFSLTKSLKTLIISMLLSFFVVKFVKLYVVLCRIVWYNSCRR